MVKGEECLFVEQTAEEVGKGCWKPTPYRFQNIHARCHMGIKGALLSSKECFDP